MAVVSVYTIWEADNYLKLTIIQGDPGDGKTTLVLNQKYIHIRICMKKQKRIEFVYI